MNPVKQAILDIVGADASVSNADFSLAVLFVQSVDIDKRICVAADSNNHKFANLRLQFIGGSSFLVPSRGSAVIAFISHALSLGYILSTSKIESAEVVIGDSSAVIDKDGCRINTANMSAHVNNEDIIFNGGKLDGLVIIQKLTDKLNELVKTVNTLITGYNAHVHICADPGAPSKPIDATAKSAASFNKADYENTKIKQ